MAEPTIQDGYNDATDAQLPRLDRDREASHDLNPLLDELGP